MGFTHGWFRMILGCYWELFPCFVLGFWDDFGEKSQKRKTEKIWAFWAPMPQRREPTPIND